MINIILFLFTLSVRPVGQEHVIMDATGDAYAGNLLFIGNRSGISQFDRITKTWGRITTANGLPDNNVLQVGLNEGIIWVVTEKGIASADIKINDWQVYEPGGIITGLDFDDDYVWLAGDFGLKRFDKYTENWETIADIPLNCLYSDVKYVWLGTSTGIIRYDREFERIEDLPSAPGLNFYHIINSPSKIWFLSSNKFAAYNKTGEFWSVYAGFPIADLTALGDSIFALSENRIFFFNPGIDAWQEFQEVAVSDSINGLSANAANLLLATNRGIILYDWRNKARHAYNSVNGLIRDTIIDVHEDNAFIFAVNPDCIQYLDKETGIWGIEETKSTAQQRQKLFYYDEAGMHAQLVRNTDIKLQGLTFFSYYLESPQPGSSAVTDRHVDLKLIAQHASDRLLSLYYDDTDEEQIIYGFGYRGLETDHLYRVNGGYLRSEYSDFTIIPKFSTLGADMKLKKADHALNMQGGQIKSSFRTDFFYGRSYSTIDSIADIAYLKNTFYRIHAVTQPIEKDYDTVYVDDQDPTTNQHGTRTGVTIGGITGDFDPLINGMDYFIDYGRGVIQFWSARDRDDIIVLLINGQELVLQSGAITGQRLENVYALGPAIVPGTLNITIVDTLNDRHPLSEFGIDNDEDDRVDPEFIDYNLGYLMFPQSRPFPDPVYDDMLNVYTMIVEFSSSMVFYNLSHNPVLSGSENVCVDGELLAGGNHYILDYTSGRLLFLKDNIVSDFSEIEVRYMSVERESQETYYSIQPDIAISRNINIAPGMSIVNEVKLAHLSGKLQAGNGGANAVKFTPQVALGSEKEIAQNHALKVNYGITSISVSYQSFSDSFEAFGSNIKKYGRLRQAGMLGLSVEPLTFIRADGKLEKEYQTDSTGARHGVQYAYGKLNYLNPRLPNGYFLLGQDELPDYSKLKVLLNANYNVEYRKATLKFNPSAYYDWIDHDDGTMNNGIEYLINASFSLPFPVSSDIRIRNNSVYQNREQNKNETDTRMGLNIDVIPGIYQFNYYEVKTSTYYIPPGKEICCQGNIYSTVNIAPGRWYPGLSIVNLSIGLGNNFNEYLNSVPGQYHFPLLLIGPVALDNISSIRNSKSLYGSIQLTPTPNAMIWMKETMNKNGYACYSLPDMTPSNIDEIRIEYEPGRLGLFGTHLVQKRFYTYPARIIGLVSVDWIKLWTSQVRTKVNGYFQKDESEYGIVRTAEIETKVNGEILLRFNNRNFITFSVGAAKHIDNLYNVTYSLIPASGLEINLVEFLYLHIDYEATILIDGITNHSFTAKATGQF